MKASSYRSNSKRSQKSEKRAALILKGRTQPGSGNVNRFDLKADVVSADWLLEDKLVGVGSYSLKRAAIEKLRNQAFKLKKKWLFRINFEPGPKVFCMDERSFLLLTGKLET